MQKIMWQLLVLWGEGTWPRATPSVWENNGVAVSQRSSPSGKVHGYIHPRRGGSCP